MWVYAKALYTQSDSYERKCTERVNAVQVEQDPALAGVIISSPEWRTM